MKKFILASMMVLFATVSSWANTNLENDTVAPNAAVRYLSTKIGQNWFFGANGSINWWQGSDRNPIGNYTTLNGPTFGGGVSVGKWITHNIAIRVAYDINRSHSFINGTHSAVAEDKAYSFLYDNNPIPDANGYCTTTFLYHNLHADAMFSPIDLIQGYYNPNRFFTPIIFAGMGLACASGDFFMIQSYINKKYNFEFSADVGVTGAFKLSQYLDLNCSLIWTAQRHSIDTWGNECPDPRPRRADYNYAGNIGLTWNIRSLVYELPVNYTKEIKEIREHIKDLDNALDSCMQREPDTVIRFVNTQTTDTIKEIVSFPLSIFFNKDSYQLMSRRDLINLQEIARTAMDKGWKIRLRGSCDSATATPEYNQKLSENRCRKIQMELMELGVPEDQIILVPVGGVNELNPTEFDRRVLIELVKEIK
jgi:outer membrane protein OmpA-like peptidoglycan-associated protein